MVPRFDTRATFKPKHALAGRDSPSSYEPRRPVHCRPFCEMAWMHAWSNTFCVKQNFWLTTGHSRVLASPADGGASLITGAEPSATPTGAGVADAGVATNHTLATTIATSAITPLRNLIGLLLSYPRECQVHRTTARAPRIADSVGQGWTRI